ncbi:glycosyltransferase family 4 protein [Lichenicola cladoniae]|nr:hypothetical protein [Lichenicola cladoniae]
MARQDMADAAASMMPFLMLALGCAAMAVSALVVRRMIGLGVLDVPGRRSAHDRPVPKGGGVGMVVAILLGVPVGVAVLPGPGRPVVATGLMLAATLLLAVVSWVDDLRQFGVRAKFGAQLGSAVLAIAAVLATMPVWPPAWVLSLALPAAFCWLMLVTNAVNFIDGLNGLAAGSALLAGLFAACLGWMLADPLLVALASMTAAGLAGFLPFNYPRARIFLGDVGSQVCGLLLGVFALLLAADGLPSSWIAPGLFVPLMLAGILWDVTFTLCRRAVARERLTVAHRGHLYQVAARSFLSPARVALVHWGFVIWGGTIGLTLLPMSPPDAVVLVLLPQIAWTAIVRHRAARAGLGRWS